MKKLEIQVGNFDIFKKIKYIQREFNEKNQILS